MLIPVIETIVFVGLVALGYVGYRHPDKVGPFFLPWSYAGLRDRGGRQFVRGFSFILGLLGLFFLFVTFLIAVGPDS